MFSSLARWTLASAALGFLCGLPRPASADMAVVDQQNPVWALALNATEMSLGQEFVPEFHGLDAVDLHFEAGSDTEDANIYVNIRVGDMYGEVVGSSDFETVPAGDGVEHELEFGFPSVVPVVPGQIYVIELVLVTDVLVYIHISLDADFESGHMLVNDEPSQHRDFRFEEGYRDVDTDGDGHSHVSIGGGDCDETDPAVSIAADEICDDGVDNDCDGDVDAADADCSVGDDDDDDSAAGDDDDSSNAAHPPTPAPHRIRGCECSSRPGGLGGGVAVLLLALVGIARGSARRRSART